MTRRRWTEMGNSFDRALERETSDLNVLMRTCSITGTICDLLETTECKTCQEQKHDGRGG